MNGYSSKIREIIDQGVGRNYDDLFRDVCDVMVDLELALVDRIYQLDCKLHPLMVVAPGVYPPPPAETQVEVPVLQETAPPKRSSIVNASLSASAKAQGFSGDACDICHNFTLKRTGTCMTCTSCGANSGCS